MENLLRDIKYGLRSMAGNPGFMTVAVLTLGLGIGANTAIFSAVNAVILRPFPYPDPDRQMEWITVVGIVGDARHKGMDVEPDAETF